MVVEWKGSPTGFRGDTRSGSVSSVSASRDVATLEPVVPGLEGRGGRPPTPEEKEKIAEGPRYGDRRDGDGDGGRIPTVPDVEGGQVALVGGVATYIAGSTMREELGFETVEQYQHAKRTGAGQFGEGWYGPLRGGEAAVEAISVELGVPKQEAQRLITLAWGTKGRAEELQALGPEKRRGLQIAAVTYDPWVIAPKSVAAGGLFGIAPTRELQLEKYAAFQEASAFLQAAGIATVSDEGVSLVNLEKLDTQNPAVRQALLGVGYDSKVIANLYSQLEKERLGAEILGGEYDIIGSSPRTGEVLVKSKETGKQAWFTAPPGDVERAGLSVELQEAGVLKGGYLDPVAAVGLLTSEQAELFGVSPVQYGMLQDVKRGELERVSALGKLEPYVTPAAALPPGVLGPTRPMSIDVVGALRADVPGATLLSAGLTQVQIGEARQFIEEHPAVAEMKEPVSSDAFVVQYFHERGWELPTYLGGTFHRGGVKAGEEWRLKQIDERMSEASSVYVEKFGMGALAQSGFAKMGTFVLPVVGTKLQPGGGRWNLSLPAIALTAVNVALITAGGLKVGGLVRYPGAKVAAPVRLPSGEILETFRPTPIGQYYPGWMKGVLGIGPETGLSRAEVLAAAQSRMAPEAVWAERQWIESLIAQEAATAKYAELAGTEILLGEKLALAQIMGESGYGGRLAYVGVKPTPKVQYYEDIFAGRLGKTGLTPEVEIQQILERAYPVDLPRYPEIYRAPTGGRELGLWGAGRGEFAPGVTGRGEPVFWQKLPEVLEFTGGGGPAVLTRAPVLPGAAGVSVAPASVAAMTPTQVARLLGYGEVAAVSAVSPLVIPVVTPPGIAPSVSPYPYRVAAPVLVPAPAPAPALVPSLYVAPGIGVSPAWAPEPTRAYVPSPVPGLVVPAPARAVEPALVLAPTPAPAPAPVPTPVPVLGLPVPPPAAVTPPVPIPPVTIPPPPIPPPTIIIPPVPFLGFGYPRLFGSRGRGKGIGKLLRGGRWVMPGLILHMPEVMGVGKRKIPLAARRVRKYGAREATRASLLRGVEAL